MRFALKTMTRLLRHTTWAIGLTALLGSALLIAAPRPGSTGGTITISQTSEPKTLNPVLAADQATRDVLAVMSADLIHINRRTLRTEPALANSCTLSADRRHFTITLRDGLRFSDGVPLTADDVTFSF